MVNSRRLIAVTVAAAALIGGLAVPGSEAEASGTAQHLSTAISHLPERIRPPKPPKPVFDRPKPVFDRPKPVFDRPKPVFDRPKPVFDRPKPLTVKLSETQCKVFTCTRDKTLYLSDLKFYEYSYWRGGTREEIEFRLPETRWKACVVKVVVGGTVGAFYVETTDSGDSYELTDAFAYLLAGGNGDCRAAVSSTLGLR